MATAFDFMHIEVPCSACGKHGFQLIRALVANNEVACTYCGKPIDVSSKEWRTAINNVADLYKKIAITKRG